MPVGADPVAARWSLRGMPGRRGGAWPTRLERASWMGFGLYAHHQRGWRDRPMQVEGVSLADGLVLLGAMGGDGFVAPLGRLLNARGLEEARGPLLRLMGVLSERGVGIDHALLASDLADLAAPALRDRTRSAWGRALR